MVTSKGDAPVVKCITLYLSYFSELFGFLAWLSNTHQQVAHGPLSWIPYFQPFPHPIFTLGNNRLGGNGQQGTEKAGVNANKHILLKTHKLHFRRLS